jgi:hypothetical protein
MLMILWLFGRSLVVGGLDHDDVRSGFGRSIDIDNLSIADGGDSILVIFDRAFGLSICVDVLSIAGGGRIRSW